MRRFLVLGIFATIGCAGGRIQANVVQPALTPMTTAQGRLDHASIAGTLHAAGQPSRNQFLEGFALGAILGPVGLAISVATADADPPDQPIQPPPAYADNSENYLLAFRRAYDAQVKSQRRSAAAGGGILGTLTSTAIFFLIFSDR